VFGIMRVCIAVLLVCVTLSGLVTSMEAEFQALQGTSAEAAAIMEQAVAAVNPASHLSQGASQLHEIAHAFRKARETHGVGRAHSHKERRNRFHLISAAVHALQAMTHDEKCHAKSSSQLRQQQIGAVKQSLAIARQKLRSATGAASKTRFAMQHTLANYLKRAPAELVKLEKKAFAADSAARRAFFQAQLVGAGASLAKSPQPTEKVSATGKVSVASATSKLIKVTAAVKLSTAVHQRAVTQAQQARAHTAATVQAKNLASQAAKRAQQQHAAAMANQLGQPASAVKAATATQIAQARQAKLEQHAKRAASTYQAVQARVTRYLKAVATHEATLARATHEFRAAKQGWERAKQHGSHAEYAAAEQKYHAAVTAHAAAEEKTIGVRRQLKSSQHQLKVASAKVALLGKKRQAHAAAVRAPTALSDATAVAHSNAVVAQAESASQAALQTLRAARATAVDAVQRQKEANVRVAAAAAKVSRVVSSARKAQAAVITAAGGAKLPAAAQQALQLAVKVVAKAPASPPRKVSSQTAHVSAAAAKARAVRAEAKAASLRKDFGMDIFHVDVEQAVLAHQAARTREVALTISVRKLGNKLSQLRSKSPLAVHAQERSVARQMIVNKAQPRVSKAPHAALIELRATPSKKNHFQCCQVDQQQRMKCHLLHASIEAMKHMSRRYSA